MYVAISFRSDAGHKDKKVLKETFEKANLSAEIEVYTDAAHGWCPPDSKVYNEPQAEKAWSRLLALYGKAVGLKTPHSPSARKAVTGSTLVARRVGPVVAGSAAPPDVHHGAQRW